MAWVEPTICIASPINKLCGWFVDTVAIDSVLKICEIVNFLGNDAPSSGKVDITFGAEEWKGCTLWSGEVFAFIWNLVKEYGCRMSGSGL